MIQSSKKLIAVFAIALTGFLSSTNFSQAQVFQIFSVAAAETNENISAAERKELITKVLTQSEKEAIELEKSIKNLKLPKEWQGNKDKFLAEIVEFKKHYDEIAEKLNEENISDENIKNIALEFKAWRENNYSKKLEEITNFILVFETESILNTVQNRLSKISGDLTKIEKQKLVKTESIKEIYNKADKKLKNAISLNEKAKSSLLAEINLKDRKIEAPILPVTPRGTSTLPIKEGPKESVRDISKNALKELKSTYELFFEMNEALKK